MATVAKPQTSTKREQPVPDEAPKPLPDEAFEKVRLDPALLVRDECNAREEDTEPDEKLITSVKEIGIQDAISVRPRPDGTYGVFKGWRRGQAVQRANATAKEDGREIQTAPAYVRKDLVGRDGWTMMLSLVENDQRRDMSPGDTLKATELALIGMSNIEVTSARKALGVRKGAEKDARKARKLNDATLRRTAAGGMDLEQTALLAEVSDVRDAENRLLKALKKDQEEDKGGRGHWDHELALLRAEQADTLTRDAALKKLQDAEIPLLPVRNSWGEKNESRPLSELATGLGNPLTEEMHRGCPGHSARLDDEHQPVWHCADPQEHGHKVRRSAQQPKKPVDEAAAEARAKVIACNKAWPVAREQRQVFITGLCRTKDLPDPLRALAVSTMVALPAFYAQWAEKRDQTDVIRFLTAKTPADKDAREAAATALVATHPKTRDLHLMVACVAAALEFSISGKKAWESLSRPQAEWLLLLESLGYTLSEVEDQAVSRFRPTKKAPAVTAA
ncbi:ParB/RepB/Spo0J family partition protein [Streptomyces sp. NPDC058595]|uniref:ParB/RepB/Spo0J family partition protein n=1 Tax=Streptomyces sp. NPDC058595 TaxID=3346550 RepID=UPI00364DA3AE